MNKKTPYELRLQKMTDDELANEQERIDEELARLYEREEERIDEEQGRLYEEQEPDYWRKIREREENE